MASSANPYGHDHRAVRESHRPAVERGEAWCAEVVCLMTSRWIQPGTPWHLAHDRVNGGYLGPAHERCNTAEGGRWRHAKRKVVTTIRRRVL